PQYTLSHTPAPATASQPCTSYQTRPTTSSSSFLYSLPRRPPSSTLFPYTTLFRSISIVELADSIRYPMPTLDATVSEMTEPTKADRKSTRLNSSHVKNSYAVFCLKKKTRADPRVIEIASSSALSAIASSRGNIEGV